MPFGVATGQKMVNGHKTNTFAFKTLRLSTERVNGKVVELHAVEGQSSAKRPAGYIVTVDGVRQQQYELTYRGNSKKASSVRVLHLDPQGHVLAEQVIDITQLDITSQVASRVPLVERAGLQRSVGRLLRGVASLVLPDQLHAQPVASDPCNGTRQNAESFGRAAAVSAGFWAGTLLACVTGVAPACGALAILGGEVAIALALADYWADELVTCRTQNPSCGATWGINGFCPSDALTGSDFTGTGNFGGFGPAYNPNGGNAPTSTGGPSGWYGGSGGAFFCRWVENFVLPEFPGDPGTTYDTWTCTAI